MLTKSLAACCPALKRQNPQTTPPKPHNPPQVPIKNFNSLYDPTAASDSSDTLTGFGSASTSRTLTTIDDGDKDASSDSEPDLSSVFAAQRLSRPVSTGRSNSIVSDYEDNVVSSGPETGRVGFGAVPKMSPDPYGDFRKSMEEMVAALGLGLGLGLTTSSCDEERRMRLQELLLCYLALNRKNEHKYIVNAFADVMRGLAAGN